MQFERGIDFPEDLNQALSLLNALFGDSLSLIDTDGSIYCAPEHREGWRQITFPNGTGRVLLYLGNQPLGPTFANLSEAKLFLMGIHFAYYGTASVESIEAFLSTQRTFSTQTEPELAIEEGIKAFWPVSNADRIVYEQRFPEDGVPENFL